MLVPLIAVLRAKSARERGPETTSVSKISAILRRLMSAGRELRAWVAATFVPLANI